MLVNLSKVFIINTAIYQRSIVLQNYCKITLFFRQFVKNEMSAISENETVR